MFEFDSKMTKEDYIEFNMFHYENSKTIMKSILLERVVGPIIFMLFTVVTGKLDDIIYMTVFITLSVLWFAFLPKYMWYIMKKRTNKLIEENKEGDLFSEKHIIIDDLGIHYESKSSSGTYNWNSVIKVCDTEKALYIYVSSIQAVVIPKRLVADQINVEELIRYCRLKGEG